VGTRALVPVDDATTAMAMEVLANYDVEAPEVLGRTEAGIINENLVVRDALGRKYFLQGYRRMQEPEALGFRLAFQQYMHDSGFPTSAILVAKSGESAVLEEGMPWVLFSFVEGDEYDFSRMDQAAEAGRMLAFYHRLASSFPGDRPRAFRAPGVGRQDRALHDASFEAYFGRGLEQASLVRQVYEGRTEQAYIEFVAEWWLSFAHDWPLDRVAALPATYVHWDYHGRNVAFAGPKLVGLFDFEFVSLGPRVVDVARGLFNFGRAGRGLFGPQAIAARALRGEFCRSFLEAYDADSPLTPEEKAAVPAFVTFNFIPDLFFHQTREAAGEDVLARFNREAPLAEAAQSEMRRLAPELGWEAP
jgi:Ser/Thr protein kinase RdoA (MazF antagonist)